MLKWQEVLSLLIGSKSIDTRRSPADPVRTKASAQPSMAEPWQPENRVVQNG